MPTLADKYRPATLDDLAGFDDVKGKIRRILARGNGAGGRAWWLSGPSGVGKTSAARIIAASLAHPASVREIDAGTLTCAALEDIADSCASRSIFVPHGNALIVNEAHGLRKDTIRRLLVWLEDLAPWTTVVFTTTTKGQMSLFEDHHDAAPLLSRCLSFDLDTKGQVPAFAAHLGKVAEREGIPVTLDALRFMLAGKSNNLRACLMELETA